MIFHFILIAVLVSVLSVMSQLYSDDLRSSDLASLDAASRNMLVYRSHVAAFAAEHPEFSGHPQDSQLGLPSWYLKPQGLSSAILDGVAYTYSQSLPAGSVGHLVSITQSIAVGINQNGILISPTRGTTEMPVAESVPDGAVVIIN